MEGKILLALNFNLNFTTPLALLEALSDKWPKDTQGRLPKEALKTISMCKFILELSLFEGLGKEYCTKTMVLSALMLADSVLKTKSESRMLEAERETIMKCFKDMCHSL